MTTILPQSATTSDVLRLVERFVDCLSEGNFEEAHSLLRQTSYYSYWTPDLIKEVICSFGPPIGATDDAVSRVTDRTKAVITDLTPHHEVTFYEDPSTLIDAAAGDVHYDLPINGVWSELTAIFGIHRDDDGVWLELEDIHVL